MRIVDVWEVDIFPKKKILDHGSIKDASGLLNVTNSAVYNAMKTEKALSGRYMIVEAGSRPSYPSSVDMVHVVLKNACVTLATMDAMIVENGLMEGPAKTAKEWLIDLYQESENERKAAL